MELLDLSDQLEHILNQVFGHHLVTLFTLFVQILQHTSIY